MQLVYEVGIGFLENSSWAAVWAISSTSGLWLTTSPAGNRTSICERRNESRAVVSTFLIRCPCYVLAILAAPQFGQFPRTLQGKAWQLIGVLIAMCRSASLSCLFRIFSSAISPHPNHFLPDLDSREAGPLPAKQRPSLGATITRRIQRPSANLPSGGMQHLARFVGRTCCLGHRRRAHELSTDMVCGLVLSLRNQGFSTTSTPKTHPRHPRTPWRRLGL